MKFLGIIFLTLISVIMLCSCGGKERLTKEEIDPYDAAIVTFLNNKSMDMKVVEFISVNAKDDDTASCIVKMQDVNGLYSIKPKWKFKFIKQDGDWIVTDYKIL